MKRGLLALALVALWATPAVAAITHEGSGAISFNVENTKSVTAACGSSADRKIFAFVAELGSNTITSMTATQGASPVAMTAIDNTSVGGTIIVGYYLDDPDTGTVTVTVNFSTSPQGLLVAGCYSGAADSVDNFTNAAQVVQTTHTTTLTPMATGWVVCGIIELYGGAVSAGAGTTVRAQDTLGDYTAAIYDSNADVSGATSLVVTTGGAGDSARVMVSFTPAAAGGGSTPRMLLLGVGE